MEYIIHLAADVGGLYKNMNNKVEMFENNILMNTNLLKCAHITLFNFFEWFPFAKFFIECTFY